jgi:hypothetical protein
MGYFLCFWLGGFVGFMLAALITVGGKDER